MKHILMTAFTALLFLSACAGKDTQASVQDEPETPPETTITENDQDAAFDPEEYLLSLPDNPLSDDRIMTITFEGIVHKELWDTFYQNSEEGKEADITVCSYTIEGDPVYTWLSYDGIVFHAVTDNSRDHFGIPEMYHTERQYLIVDSFTTEEEINGGIKTFQHLRAYMTDDENRKENSGATAEGFVYPEDDDYYLWGYSWIKE